MAKYYRTEEEVRKALKVDSFSNPDESTVQKFIGVLPRTDKDVALGIIGQFSTFVDFSSSMLTQLNVLCDNALKSNDASQRESLGAYRQMLDELGEDLKDNTLSSEEKERNFERMLLVADRISAKDSENKQFINGILKYGAPVLGGILVLGAAILGVKVYHDDK